MHNSTGIKDSNLSELIGKSLNLKVSADIIYSFDVIIIINNRKLRERRNHMEELMKSWNLKNFVFIDPVPPEKITNPRYSVLFNDATDLKRYKDIVNASFRSESITQSIHVVKPMSPGEKSLAWAHFSAWQAVARDQRIKHALILEDDVFVIGDGDPFQKISEFILDITKGQIADSPWILYPGNGQGPTETMASFIEYSQQLLINRDHLSKYSDTYIINNNAATLLTTCMLPFAASVDWQMTWGSKCCNITSFHAKNPVTRQGSGQEFKSTLRP